MSLCELGKIIFPVKCTEMCTICICACIKKQFIPGTKQSEEGFFLTENCGQIEVEALKVAQQLIRFLLTQPHLSVTLLLHAHIYTGSVYAFLFLLHTTFPSPHAHACTHKHREDSSPLTTVKDRQIYLHLFREARRTNKSPLTD